MDGNSNCLNVEHGAAEEKLWRSVIADAVEEWMNGPLLRRREAEQFLFEDQEDFRTVCFSAGIDPNNLRSRLEKIRKTNGSSLNRDNRNHEHDVARRAA